MRRSAALLVLWIGLVPLATLLVFAVHVHDRFQARTAESLYLRAALLADGLSLSRANLFADGNRDTLRERLSGMVTEPGLASLRVTDRQGRTLVEVRPDAHQALAASGTTQTGAAHAAPTDSVQIEGDQVYVWRPIDGGDLGGWLRAGFDIGLLGRADSEYWRNATIIGVIATTLSLFLLVLLMGRSDRMLARPAQHRVSLSPTQGAVDAPADRRETRPAFAWRSNRKAALEPLTRLADHTATSAGEAPNPVIDNAAQADTTDHTGGAGGFTPIAMALEVMPVPIALFGADDALLAWNDPWRGIMEALERELASGASLCSVLSGARDHGLFGEAVPKSDDWILQQATRCRQGLGLEWQLLSGGRYFTVSSASTQSGGLLLALTDVTKFHVREETLRFSERRFRDFVEISADWWWETDLDQKLTFLRAASPEARPFEFGRYEGRPLRELLESLDAVPMIAEILAAYMANGEAFRDIEVQRHEDKGTTSWEGWMRISGKPVLDDKGVPISYRGIIFDITDQKQTETALRESQVKAARAQSQLIDAIESNSDGFCLFDAEDRIVLHNARYRDIHPLVAELIVPGARFEDVLPEGVKRGQYRDLANASESSIRD